MSRRLSVLVTSLILLSWPHEAGALELRWSTGAQDIQVVSSRPCTLLVRSTAADDSLPTTWNLSWAAYADSTVPLRVLPDDGSFGIGSVAEIRPPVSDASVVAKCDTVVMSASGAARATLARHIFWVAAGTTARIRLVSVGSGLPQGTPEVTINGGSAPSYAPLLQDVGVAYTGESPTFTLAGASLDRVARANLVQENTSPAPLAIAHQDSTVLVLQGEGVPSRRDGYLEVQDAAGFTSSLPVSTTTLGLDEQWDPTHVLVRFHPGMIDPPTELTGGSTSSFQASTPALLESLTVAGVVKMQRLFPWFRHEDVHSFNQLGEPVTLEDLADVYVADLEPNANVMSARDRLSALPEVLYACRDLTSGGYTPPPNDPYFTAGPQWGLSNPGPALCGLSYFGAVDIGAPTAWDRSTGSPSIKVAILDSGIDNAHQDLFTVAVLDTSFVPTEPSPVDFSSDGHGTAVTGIAAAHGNDGFGVTGVGWNLTPVAVKVFNAGVTGEASWIASGIDRARIKGYPICNISGGIPKGPGLPPPSAAEVKVINDACYNAYIAGVFIVGAAGNTVATGVDDFTDPEFLAYPAALSQRVFAVGAFQPDDLRWRDRHFWPPWCDAHPAECAASNSGLWLDLLAPGGRLIVTDRSSTAPDTFYHLRACNNTNPTGSGFSGTSAAAPFVSGTAGLLKSFALGFTPPVNLTNDDVEQILKKTPAYYGPFPSVRFDRWYGYGDLRAGVALNFIAPPKIVIQNDLYDSKPLAALVVGADSVFIPSRTFQNVTGLPTSSYTTSCWRIHLTGTARHGGFASTPSIWVRPSGTQGWRDTVTFNADYEVPWARITSVGTDSSSFETYLYRIPLGGGVEKYFPVAPPQARIAFTAVGSMRTVGVEEQTWTRTFEVRTSPNPSLNGVRIDLDLPRKGAARVNVLDVAGRTVATLADGLQEAGAMKLRWDGRG